MSDISVNKLTNFRSHKVKDRIKNRKSMNFIQAKNSFCKEMCHFSFNAIPILRLLSFIMIIMIASEHLLVSAGMVTTSASAPLRTIIVGGSSGMGKACAKSVVARGGKVLIVSRSLEKLEKAAIEIRQSCNVDEDENIVQTYVLDASMEEDVKAFADSLDTDVYDTLVVSCAGRAPHGSIVSLESEKVQDLFGTKFWSAYYLSKYISPKLKDYGSIAFVGGILNRRPGINCAPLAATNGALEGLTRALALEFGPRLRVNCLSPGFCDTERFDHMDEKKRSAMLKNTAESLPLKRVGMPEDMGEALYYLLSAPFVTGIVLDCDGGHGIRQYASATSDPMRNKKL